MKKFYLLTKTLLVATLLMVGANAWADVEITETYDFGTFVANGAPALTTSGDAIAQSGASEKVGSVYLIGNPTGTTTPVTLDLNGRFAVDYNSSAGSKIRFMWRKDGTAYKNGLAGNWNDKGTADPQGAARFSVLNLKAGDKITFTFAIQSGRDATPYTCSASQLTGKVADAALASGTQYTVAADGNLDLYFVNNNFAISKIVIVTTGTETVSEPTFAITGAYNRTRKVTITAGTSDAGNDVTTYYTIDGSTPTTSSASFTTASQEITVGESAESESTVTVKAYSVSSASAESTVSSQNVTVGTIIKLAQPSITMTNMGLDGGKYYKQYTFAGNSAGTYGTPVITVAGTLGGESVANPYTASTAGTISVVASADGYADSDAATLDVDGAAFLLARAYDFTQDSYRDGLSVEGNNITITGAGVQVYRIYDVNHVEGLTLSNTNFGITKAQNSDTRKGIAPRWGAGTITINNWIDGSFATLTDLVGNGVYATSSNGTFSFGGQINNNTFTALNIYTPADATVSVEVSAAGMATYVPTYALDFTGATKIKAYKVQVTAKGVATMDGVDQVPAGTPVLLVSEGAQEEAIPVIASAADVDDNDLVAGDATTASEGVLTEAGGYTNMILNDGSEGIGFYFANGQTVATNRAYLHFASALAPDNEETARGMILEFADDILTGISEAAATTEAVQKEGKFVVDGKLVIFKKGMKFNANGARIY